MKRDAKGYTAKEYTYRVFWHPEDEAYVALVDEFPSLSSIEDGQEEALRGLTLLVGDVLDDMAESGEEPPVPLGSRRYSGTVSLRMTPDQHRRLAMEAAEAGVSLNKLITSKI